MKTAANYTIPRFHCKATLGMIVSGGAIVRNECQDNITLGTEIGVQRWIKASNPLVSLKVLEDSKDVTDQFKQYAEFVPSRYGNPVSYINMKEL